MKRQVSFSNEPEAYRFTLVGANDVSFEISKNTLAFSTNEFYKLFFKGLDEKPEYEVAKPDEELAGQAKHVFDTVAAIFKKACDSIDADWFTATEEQPSVANDDLSEQDF